MSSEILTQIRIAIANLDVKFDQLKEAHKEIRIVDGTARKALELASKSADDLKEIKDSQKWLWRTVLGALIIGIIGLGFSYISKGVG